MGRHAMHIRTEELREQAMSYLRRAALGFHIEFKSNSRTLEQNDRMWAMLTEVSLNVPHHGIYYTPENWKVLFMHGLGNEMNMAPSLDGKGIVPLHGSTRKMSIPEMSDLMDYMTAYCAEQGYTLTDPRHGDERAA